MSDLPAVRTNEDDRIQNNPAMRLKHSQILLAERLNVLAQLDIEIEKLKSIQLKKLELQKDVVTEEIAELKVYIQKLAVGEDEEPIEAEFDIVT